MKRTHAKESAAWYRNKAAEFLAAAAVFREWAGRGHLLARAGYKDRARDCILNARIRRSIARDYGSRIPG